VTNTAAQITSGQVRGFFVSSAQRLPVLPDLPTMREAGLEDAAVVVWHGLYVPAATPPDVVTRLSGALQTVLASEGMRVRLAELGASPVSASDATPDALRNHLATELLRWRSVIELTGLRPQ
jgi:tripartite-type tricarboxylate transporter receptor subunit TctC